MNTAAFKSTSCLYMSGSFARNFYAYNWLKAAFTNKYNVATTALIIFSHC